ncbi:DUF2339 domain-containing protein [Nocardia callitridis]|uniref:DUF2339 domain-containing protein n=1 Tax=Nocardia callitridis TaxID=648753 RepID=A0ABP9JYB9_9NOCA
MLAVAGVGVTLIGVVMLLVLAAQAGWFGPVPRVLAGAAFSVGLVAAGIRVFGREGGRIGAIALAATGFAGMYLDVVAVSATYHWLHPLLGFAVAFGVAAGGVALAMRWNSQPLAVLVILGAAVLTPVLTTSVSLLACLIALQLACVPVHSVREWPYLHVVRTLPAVLACTAFIAWNAFDNDSGRRPLLLLAAAAILLVGLVATLAAVRVRPTDVTASVMLAAATVPALLVPGMYTGERTFVVAIATTVAAVLLAIVACATVPIVRELVRVPAHTTVVAAVAGAFAVLEACFGATNTQTLPIAFLLVAVAYLAVAGQRRARVAAVTGAVFAVLGALTLLDRAGPGVLSSERLSESRLGVSTILGALLALAVVAVGMWCAGRLPGVTVGSAGWVCVSIVGLYAVTVVAVSIGVATGAADGFLIGHSAATILWMIAATSALFYGLRHLAESGTVAKLALGSGLSVTAAALAKLFLFDLATLDGLLRVAAFLAVGVLLLVVGTRYARAFADASAQREHSPT